MKIPFVVLFLAVGLSAVLAQPRFEYFGVGGELILNPVNPPRPITSITWKHKGNIAAEWIKDKVPLEFLGDFKGRSELNLTSGQLKIKNTKKTDEGEYTVEINNNVQSVGFFAKEIKSVPEPEVVVRPLTCNMDSPDCKLSCEGKSGSGVTESEPVQYFWKKGDGPWEEAEKDMNITNNDKTQGVHTFSCKMKNKISERQSEPTTNPFTKNKDPGTSNVVGVVFGVVGIVVVGALSVFGYWKREKIKTYFTTRGNNPVENNDGAVQETPFLNSSPDQKDPPT